jgi:hypothetical protein
MGTDPSSQINDATCVRTLRLKVKPDAYSWLNAAASEVNQVWNYVNEISARAARPFAGAARYPSGYDLDKLTAGATEYFGHIGSETIQRVNAGVCDPPKTVQEGKVTMARQPGCKTVVGLDPV